MRTLTASVLLFVSTAFFQQCESNVRHYSIPEEDRFIYEPGDHLLYNCSNGSTDTVVVLTSGFWTEKGTYDNLLGNQESYELDHLRFIIKKNDEEWFDAIMKVDSFDLQEPGSITCLTVETSGLDYPGSWIVLACDRLGGIVFAVSNERYDERSINNSLYKNVCSYSSYHSDSAKYEILWNLKYGVIRFSEFTSGAWTHWDLEGKIQVPL